MASNGEGKTAITADTLKWLWPFILAVVTIASSWGIAQSQVKYNEQRICALETKAERTQETYAAIQTQLAEIQRDLQYLRRDVDRQSGQD